MGAEQENSRHLDKYFCASRKRKDLWNSVKSSISNVCTHDRDNESGKDEELRRLLDLIEELKILECYWAFPGTSAVEWIKKLYQDSEWNQLKEYVGLLARFISNDHYRNRDWILKWHSALKTNKQENYLAGIEEACSTNPAKPYFEILVVDSLDLESKEELINHHLNKSSPDDEFTYNVVVVDNAIDALIAVTLNYNIQCCILRYTFPLKGEASLDAAWRFIKKAGYTVEELSGISGAERVSMLAKTIKTIRPEISLYHLSESPVEYIAENLHESFARCFFGSEDYPEMRLSILKGIYQRYETPFFNALESYTQRPTGVFHALPISRSKSISKSHWIRDYGEFYGERMFLAETSSTTGGLDSLHKPKGSLLKAQRLAARAFGSNKCLFVTNGTSTSNKIVLNAITEPNDIVLMAEDSHKSHYHAAIMSGFNVEVLKSYEVKEYGIHGGVPIKEIKKALLRHKEWNTLNSVRALVITNLTFDGIAYDLERLISECLSIKQDLIFLIDEAWFGYGNFAPTTNRRSAMAVARRLKEKIKSKEYEEFYCTWREKQKSQDVDEKSINQQLNKRLYPHPSAKIRVYSTQSTHKTLTALRQGSMIQIQDECYNTYLDQKMTSSYQSHTSTSPNYQIIASLDIARRQVHFEGYELIQKAFELSFLFRKLIIDHKMLRKYFKPLDQSDMIPEELRTKDYKFDKEHEYWSNLDESWEKDEFSLDPTRVTIDIRKTGKDGNEIKKILMDRFDIQVNKTTKTTILIIMHIGVTRGMVTYLLESLMTIAKEIDKKQDIHSEENDDQSSAINETRTIRGAESLNVMLTSQKIFHPSFCLSKIPSNNISNIRNAAEAAKKESTVKYVLVDDKLKSDVSRGIVLISATIVTPYPPGFPILLPGQIVTSDIINALLKLGNTEVHGYSKEDGLLVFRDESCA